MNLALPQYPDSRLLTHSSVQTFRTCARKYYLAYVLGLRPSHDSEPLRLGSMWHLGIGIYESGIPIEEAIGAIREAYAATPRPPYLEEDEYQVEEEIVCAMVQGHYNRWKDSAILETLAIELPFNLPIRNPATDKETPLFRQAGQIDRVCRLPDNRLAHVERKTVGESIELNSDYWRRMTMDSQISRYVLAERAMGYDIATTVYDVARKPEIRPKNIAKADRAWATSQGRYFDEPLTETCPERETPRLFAARFRDDMKKRPDFYFQRAEIPRLQSDLDEFEAEQWQLQRSIRSCELDAEKLGKVAWPRNTGACTNPYRCQFFEVCTGQAGDPEKEIPQGFKRTDRLHKELKQGETNGHTSCNGTTVIAGSTTAV